MSCPDGIVIRALIVIKEAVEILLVANIGTDISWLSSVNECLSQIRGIITGERKVWSHYPLFYRYNLEMKGKKKNIRRG